MKEVVCTASFAEFREYVLKRFRREETFIISSRGAFTGGGSILKFCPSRAEAEDMYGFKFVYLAGFMDIDQGTRDEIFRLDAKAKLRYYKKTQAAPYTPSRKEEGDINGPCEIRE